MSDDPSPAYPPRQEIQEVDHDGFVLTRAQALAMYDEIECLRKAGDAMYYVVEWVESDQADVAVGLWEKATGRTVPRAPSAPCATCGGSGVADCLTCRGSGTHPYGDPCSCGDGTRPCRCDAASSADPGAES